MEAAGAGAAKDRLRPTQDAQLDGGHGYQPPGLTTVFPGSSVQMPMAAALLPL